jgi:hypothetical protein
MILKELILQPWVQDRYLLSDIDGRTFLNGPESYGVIMLIDKYLDLRQLLSFPFHTKQGRQLLFAQIQLRTEIFLIGTVHLESMRDGKVFRSHQLQTCQSVFNRYAMNHSNVTRLLMGDFNFDAHWTENAIQMNILNNWIDLWSTLKGPNNLGLTHGNVRFDRIMLQSLRIIPIQIRIIGNKPIGQFSKKRIAPTNIFDSLSFDQQHQDMRNIFPSDHFGLMADFDLSHV